MNELVEAATKNRKFMDLPEEEVDEKLKAQKQANPKSIPYAVCWMEMHPGYLSLRYVNSSNPRNVLIGITPKGFSWEGRNFRVLDELFEAFKNKAKEKIRETAASKPAAPSRWRSRPAPPPLPRPPPPAQPDWARRPSPPRPPMPPTIAPVDRKSVV